MTKFKPLSESQEEVNVTSFHNVTISTTVAQLRQILGEPIDENNSGVDKVNFEWAGNLEVPGKTVPFTIYDWKHCRPIREDEIIIWHIGGESHQDTILVKMALIKSL